MVTITYHELSTLTNDLGFSTRALYAASNNIEKHYRKIKIPKHNGGERELSVPDRFLKAIQKRIVPKLLCYEEVSPHATAYRYGGSTVKNARPHLGQPMILKLDIRHFFDSIIYPMIKDKVFPKERYSECNRILLSLLCSYEGRLPQGAPTSPFISNIVMRDFDDAVGTWCLNKNIRYTRYCDDMTFSGNFCAEEVIDFVKNKLSEMGFFLNSKKTVVAHDGQQKNVTGIVVNEKLSISQKYRKDIRRSLYYCKKYGVKSLLEHQNLTIPEEVYLQKLLGKINYVLAVNPADNEMHKYRNLIIEKVQKQKGGFKI